MCLNNRVEYSAEVVKEALRTLAQDNVPPFPIMRTAILSGQAFADVKRFVLTDVAPSLIRKKVWISAPKVWEGVLFAIKNVPVAHKMPEQILVSVLSLPGQQLRAVMTAAPSIVQSLTVLLCGMTPDKLRDMSQTIIEGAVSSDSLKERIFQDLMATKS